VYIFADNQTIEKNTPCYKFDLNKFISKYNLYQRRKSGMPNAIENDYTRQLQTQFYQAAISEILEEFSDRIASKQPSRPKKGKTDNTALASLAGSVRDSTQTAAGNYINLFLLSGQKVMNLQDVAEDAKILIASEGDEFIGVEFKDYRLQ
jgi:hypothetical protein